MTFVSRCPNYSDLDRCDFGDFKRSLNNTDHGYQIIKDGKDLIERFEVRPGDCSAVKDSWSDCKNDRERSELREQDAAKVGDECEYSWEIRFDKNYKNIFPTKVALGQFFQNKKDEPLGPVWIFQNQKGGLWLDRQSEGKSTCMYQLVENDNCLKNWTKVCIKVKWTKSTDGYFKVLINDEEKFSSEGAPTMDPGAGEIRFKYGLYRSFISRYYFKEIQNSENKCVCVPGQIVEYKNVCKYR